ncbi:MAG: hypothetical protein GXY05_16655, partial [Clostridiales bacterium]|nr:hypothetical protein [Clostridiales bacterium]
MDNKLRKWLTHTFSTGGHAGEDYLQFQREMKAGLKKDCAANGFELHT